MAPLLKSSSKVRNQLSVQNPCMGLAPCTLTMVSLYTLYVWFLCSQGFFCLVDLDNWRSYGSPDGSLYTARASCGVEKREKVCSKPNWFETQQRLIHWAAGRACHHGVFSTCSAWRQRGWGRMYRFGEEEKAHEGTHAHDGGMCPTHDGNNSRLKPATFLPTWAACPTWDRGGTLAVVRHATFLIFVSRVCLGKSIPINFVERSVLCKTSWAYSVVHRIAEVPYNWSQPGVISGWQMGTDFSKLAEA